MWGTAKERRQHLEEAKGIPLTRVKNLLRRFDLKPKKRLGQHFLIDDTVVERIVTAAELTTADTVVEVGPGLGILTEELARRAGQVIAIELDTRLASLLRQTFSSLSTVTVINTDILQWNPSDIKGSKQDSAPNAQPSATSYKVAANLPYYITSPVLRHFLEASFKPCLMIVMVQKEVGEAIAAVPGGMSLLSVSVQFYSKPTIITYVPAQSFYPPPKVDSVVLRLDPYPTPPVKVSNVAGFFKIVEAGFSSRRKQLHNSLAQGLNLPPNMVAALLEQIDISPKRRAETLSLEEWAKVWKRFQQYGEGGCANSNSPS